MDARMLAHVSHWWNSQQGRCSFAPSCFEAFQILRDGPGSPAEELDLGSMQWARRTGVWLLPIQVPGEHSHPLSEDQVVEGDASRWA